MPSVLSTKVNVTMPAGLVATTWPMTSQSNSMRIAARCCSTVGFDIASYRSLTAASTTAPSPQKADNTFNMHHIAVRPCGRGWTTIAVRILRSPSRMPLRHLSQSIPASDPRPPSPRAQPVQFWVVADERQHLKAGFDLVRPIGRGHRVTAQHRRSSTVRGLSFAGGGCLLAEADRAEAGRDAAALPPSLPPLRDGAWFSGLPRPLPLFFPPPVSLLTVAQARRSASSSETPRRS